MRLRSQHSALLFLLLPSLSTALSVERSTSSQDLLSSSGPGAETDGDGNGDVADTTSERQASIKANAAVKAKAKSSIYDDDTEDLKSILHNAGLDDDDDVVSSTYTTSKSSSKSSKTSLYDDEDGKPHQGPFVETDGVTDKSLPPLANRPDDPTIVDGKRIPKTNDGIMFDKDREHPQEGTTGLEGGVSEKAAQNKAQESKTGGKDVVAPKEPLSGSGSTTYADDDTYSGIDVDAADRTNGEEPPVSGKKAPHVHHWDSKGRFKGHTHAEGEPEGEGIIQPFHSFILSFTMILVSEIGDKTFLVAALMAMKHDRLLVFSAAFSALVVMTVLSAFLGHTVPSLIPKALTSFLAAGLFFVFGARLLIEGMGMDPNEGVDGEMHEVEQELAQREKHSGREEYAMEMGLNGERGRANGRYSPPRSPSTSPVRRNVNGTGLRDFLKGSGNLFSLLLSPAWVQTFVMTFLGEWGDRSQIATIAMSAGQDYWWVTLGSLCGHSICTGVAVIGGRAIAGKVSMKVGKSQFLLAILRNFELTI